MTKKQFLDVVNEIDDEFINEIIDIPDKISEKPQDNYFVDEKPQVVYLTNERIPFWKIAVSTAAAVCVLTAGFFAAAKLHGVHTYDPNESGISDSSTTVSESMSTSEPIISERLDLSERGDGVPFEARFFEDDQSPIYTDAVVKKDGEQYATLQVACRGVSDEKSFVVSVFRKREMKCIGRIEITEPGAHTLYIDYLEEAEDGEEYVLCIYGEGNTRIDGEWVP